MSNDEHPTHPTDESPPTEGSPRTHRARHQEMDVALFRVGVYAVASSSGNQYEVDVLEKTCTCPDWQETEPAGGCKHIRRVNLEIRAGRVPRPDGRLPTQAVADGGQRFDRAHESEPNTPERISGPHWEFDCHGDCTGVTFYRCERCGEESLHRTDLLAEPCCNR